MKKSLIERIALCVLILSLAVAIVAGGAYAKYVTNLNYSGTVNVSVNLGSITLNDTAKTYNLIPGVDIVKEASVTVELNGIPVYVYLIVDTNIVQNKEGIQYTLKDCWQPISVGSNVYVYCDENKAPIALTKGDTIGILNDDIITVSQYVKYNVTETVYLNFTAVMKQAVDGMTAAQIYTNN